MLALALRAPAGDEHIDSTARFPEDSAKCSAGGSCVGLVSDVLFSAWGCWLPSPALSVQFTGDPGAVNSRRGIVALGDGVLMCDGK